MYTNTASQIQLMLFAQTKDTALGEARDIFQRIGESVFNTESIVILIVVLTIALVLGRITAAILRRVTKIIGAKADKIEDLAAVTRLRRLETLIVLSIAVIRTLLVLFAIYFWWVFTHPGQQPTAILGAGAVLTILISVGLRPILNDVASGSVMMAEHWYGVGDHIRVEPFIDAQGVVERVTLRSTRIRKFSGEILWINNKDIAGVSITPKGVRSVAIELFAKDHEKAIKLIEDTNLRLPQGPLAVASPLIVMTSSAVGKDLWHITAISEVAPGREWLLDKFAIEVIQELDEKYKTLAHEPISRWADSEAERRFARTILNARKIRVHRENVVAKVTRKHNEANKSKKSKSTSK